MASGVGDGAKSLRAEWISRSERFDDVLEICCLVSGNVYLLYDDIDRFGCN